MSDLTKLIVTAALGFASGIAAAVVGAFFVHKLTRSRDHDLWVRDSRIKEWQELLNSLTNAYMVQLSLDKMMVSSDTKIHDALADVDITLSTRIFIADDIERLGIRKKWAALITAYSWSSNSLIRTFVAENEYAFKKGFQEMRMSIVEVAKQTK